MGEYVHVDGEVVDGVSRCFKDVETDRDVEEGANMGEEVHMDGEVEDGIYSSPVAISKYS